MARIIGDRKEKSALDEMEEVARERNRDVAEEERLETLKKAKEEAERAKAPSGDGSINTIDYHGLEFEAKAQRDENTLVDIKTPLSYDESLKRIKKAKFERHPSPSEAFSLLIDNLEGKLSGNLKAVAEDMHSGCGEWLSMAMERKGDILVCYLHPEGLIWNGSRYIQRGFMYNGKQEFNISGKKSRTWIPISAFDDDFVKLVYGRSFKELPEEMREGDRTNQIFLPPKDVLGPVSCNDVDRYKLIVGSYDYILMASRGVRSGGSSQVRMNELIEELSMGRINA